LGVHGRECREERATVSRQGKSRQRRAEIKEQSKKESVECYSMVSILSVKEVSAKRRRILRLMMVMR
jgi:hypothetical protein